MKLTPSATRYLNYSQVQLSTSFSSDLSYHAPRYMADLFIYPPSCTDLTRSFGLDPNDPVWKYEGFTVPNAGNQSYFCGNASGPPLSLLFAFCKSSFLLSFFPSLLLSFFPSLLLSFSPSLFV
jgi:hypothetical protein